MYPKKLHHAKFLNQNWFSHLLRPPAPCVLLSTASSKVVFDPKIQYTYNSQSILGMIICIIILDTFLKTYFFLIPKMNRDNECDYEALPVRDHVLHVGHLLLNLVRYHVLGTIIVSVVTITVGILVLNHKLSM